MGIFNKIFKSYSDSEIKRIMPKVENILALENEMQALSNKDLQNKTSEFKNRLQNGETLDDILVEAFAVVREASWRVLGMKHFPSQLIGGIVLHQGRIAEMKTGEGKTLVATLPAYLNALNGKGVHIVTVNEYLAKYQSEWMGKLYKFLGLSVGLIVNSMGSHDKIEAYQSDITYGTNNEFGFDYLRDNMVIYKDNMSQRGHVFAIVDEVDSILIDEARTPLIISGQGDASTELYSIADRFARSLKFLKVKETDDKELQDDVDADYVVDEKAKTVTLTARGIKKAEQSFNIENLSDPENMTVSHHINQAIRAHGIMKNDIDYVVKDGEVIIVDEFTGRLMIGRRYNEGLHQAIEAKEGVKVAHESKTLATITFQNYFRLYEKLSGMTGTALTEEAEFREIYKLDVVVIPTNKPMIRQDMADQVYRTENGKFKAVVRQIEECNKTGQPVLVGTVSIEKSEQISNLLRMKGIKHQVLNAKQHEKEAQIIAQAGKLGTVTIATNMAGRGTDIMLGGNAEFMAINDLRKQGLTEELITEATGHAETDDEEIIDARNKFSGLLAKYKVEVDKEHEAVVSLGGLFIIGTERHESRRIDNQLRGRSGRQGDPGASRFYIALEDDLMRLFGSERLEGLLNVTKIEEDEPIEAGMLTKAIENAQKKVEGNNFGIRKNVLKYDDVMNTQREMIYKQRKQVLDGESLRDVILKMADNIVDNAVKTYAADRYADNWNWAGLEEYCESNLLLKLPKYDNLNAVDQELIKEDILKYIHQRYEAQEEVFGESMREVERVIMLQVVDRHWMQHIDDMDQMRHGVGLRAYAQRDPVIEYQMIGYDMFDEMIMLIKEETVKYLLSVRPSASATERKQVAKVTSVGASDGTIEKKPTVRKDKKVGRNDPCPCGSGKKYKFCHGNQE